MDAQLRGPTNQELLAFVHDRGFTDVTSRQLRRWRDQGLLPELIREGQGRGEGVMFFNPPGAKEQLVALLELKREREDQGQRFTSDWVGWELHARGFPVVEFVRNRVLGWVREWHRRLAGEYERFDSDDPNNIIDQADLQPDLPALLATMADAAGGAEASLAVRTAIEVCLGIWTGVYGVGSEETAALDRAWEAAFGDSDAEGVPDLLVALSEGPNLPVLEEIFEEASDDEFLDLLGWLGVLALLWALTSGRLEFKPHVSKVEGQDK